MTYYLYKKDDGTPDVSEYRLPAPPPGWTLVRESEEPINLNNASFGKNDELVIDNRLQRKQAVDSELSFKQSRAVEFSGIKLDAGVAAKKAMLDKLIELDFTTPKLDKLYWRDADNVDKAFSSVKEYRDFLRGALAGIMTRDTDAQAWAFAEKAKIDKGPLSPVDTRKPTPDQLRSIASEEERRRAGGSASGFVATPAIPDPAVSGKSVVKPDGPK